MESARSVSEHAPLQDATLMDVTDHDSDDLLADSEDDGGADALDNEPVDNSRTDDNIPQRGVGYTLSHHAATDLRNGTACLSSGDTSLAASSSAASSHAVMSRLALCPNKAGMDGVDKEHANKIILAASQGSRYYENELRKEKKTAERVDVMLRRAKMLSKSDDSAVRRLVDREVKRLESLRNLARVCVHIDMDSFYASVEMRDNPELKEKPIGVGGTSMLSTANYVARKYGVRSAMPGYIAKRLCPDLVFVRPRFDAYKAASKTVRGILEDYDPNLHMASLDEAYLDITDYLNRTSLGQDGAEAVVEEMRRRIFQATQLTASAGIACNSMLAKICSDKNKPNGQFMLKPERQAILSFMWELPIRRIPGIGKVTERVLQALGIEDGRGLWDNRYLLKRLFSETSFKFFLRACLGVREERPEDDERTRKSISCERTFHEISDPAQLHDKCASICRSLAADVEKHRLSGRTVTLKLKTIDFAIKQRAVSLPDVIHGSDELTRVAQRLLDRELSQGPLRLRLMGVRLSALEKLDKAAAHQRSLMDFVKMRRSADGAEPDTETVDQCGPCKAPSPKAAAVKASVGKSLHDEDSKQHIKCSSTVPEHESQDRPPADPAKSDVTSSPVRYFFVKPGSSDSEASTATDDRGDAEALGSHAERQRSPSIGPPGLLPQVSARPTCPVCMKPLETDNNLAVNMHVDACLNRSVLQQLSSRENPGVSPSRARRSRERTASTDTSVKRQKTRKKSRPLLSNANAPTSSSQHGGARQPRLDVFFDFKQPAP